MAHNVTQTEWEEEMSYKILGFLRNELYLDLRFMDMALSALIWKYDASLDTMATDGNFLYFSSEQLIRVFKKNSHYLNRLYLHSVLHCVYEHLFICGDRIRDTWNIACDIAVEYTIDSLDKPSTKRPLSWIRKQVYDEIEASGKKISAAVIYKELVDKEPDVLHSLRREFYTDSHIHWPKEEKMSAANKSIQNKWNKISRQSQMELEKNGEEQKDGSQILKEQIQAKKSRRSYREFLKKFAMLREELHCDPDEFDLNYYTYGLQLYHNMPLIEPLETREVMKIQEFVVVLDTSYSTNGELVKKFLEETYTILSDKHSFFADCHMHIIQCDDTVQSDDEIKNLAQLQKIVLRDKFELTGGGGTDFRPAFEYVNQLIKDGELKNMRGLLYFTDGKGIYPAKRPAYKTAFVFADEYEEKNVPPWAMKAYIS